MPGTIDDFIQRFGGGGSVSDTDAQQAHDRFMSDRPEDSSFDRDTYHQGATQYLGQLPDDQFQQGAANAFQQADPNQRQSLLGGLLGGIGGAGVLGGLASRLGLGSTNPNQMNAQDYGKVLNYARREHPEVVQQTVQQQPWFMKAMGNPMIMGALAMLATKMMRDRFSPR